MEYTFSILLSETLLETRALSCCCPCVIIPQYPDSLSMCSRLRISGEAAVSITYEQISVCRCSKGRGSKDTVKDTQPDTYVRLSLSFHTKVNTRILFKCLL